MSESADLSSGASDPDWVTFAALNQMTNHWDRPGWWPTRSAYYWYLSFREQHGVHSLATQCQAVVAAPQFDLVEESDLHMTLERVAFTDEIDATGRKQVEQNAARILDGFPALNLQIGPLAGSSGALSFSASPIERISQLRSLVLVATQAAGFATDVPTSRPFRPHVGIAYCNRTIDAAPVIAQVGALRTLPPVSVCISEVVLVTLTRHERTYTWDVAYRLPLASDN